MAGGASAIQPLNFVGSKRNVWKLRDTYGKHETAVKPLLVTGSHADVNSKFSNSGFQSEPVENLISARARMDLSRAARRAVLEQQKVLLKGDIQYKRRHLKTSNSSRKRQQKGLSEGQRSEVYSAPPLLGLDYRQQDYQSASSPPKIVVISASHHSGSEKSDTGASEEYPLRSPRSEGIWKEPQSPCFHSTDFTPRSMMSTDSSTFLGAYSPDAKLSDYGHRTNNTNTPRKYNSK